MKLFYIRTEHLKIKRTRILPIKYWISDKKRYSSEADIQNYPYFIFKNIKNFNIDYKLLEKKNEQYVISNIESYKKIIDKIVDKTLEKISIFFSKKTSNNLPKKMEIYDDIITNEKKFKREILNNFEINKKNVFLMTNTKDDSPAFHSFLYQRGEDYNFTSFGNISSNLNKEEIPSSKNNLLKFEEGKFDSHTHLKKHIVYKTFD